MILRPSICLLLLASLTLTALPAVAADPAPAATSAPVEVYGALPGARAARLSPNGKRLALIVPVKGRDTLVIWDLEGKEKSLAIPTGEFEPDWFVWKTDRRLLASLRLYQPARSTPPDGRHPADRHRCRWQQRQGTGLGRKLQDLRPADPGQGGQPAAGRPGQHPDRTAGHRSQPVAARPDDQRCPGQPGRRNQVPGSGQGQYQ